MRFTVRRPPSGEVFPCCHRPPGGDVACSINVGIAPASSAGLTLEDRLALTVFRFDVSARGATLRCVRSWDLFDTAESLVLQASNKLAPTAFVYSAIEPTFLSDTHTRLVGCTARGSGHPPNVKSLDPDQVEPPRNVCGGLLDPVLSPIPLASLQFRDCPPDLLAAVRTAMAASESALQRLHPLQLTRGQTRCVQQLASGKCRRYGHTAVDADYGAVARTVDLVGDVGERDVPATSPITGHPVGLNPIWHRARQTKTHPPDLGQPDPPKSAVQPVDVPRFHRYLSKSLMHTGFAPLRAAVCAVEEVLHGLCEIPQRLLLHHLATGAEPRVFGASLGQLRRLLDVAGRPAPRLPKLLLLHRQIPYIARVPAMPQQYLLLIRTREQSIPRHTRTITTATDIFGRGSTAPHEIGPIPKLHLQTSIRRRLR